MNRFKEIQRFNQWWLWVLLITIGILPLYAIYYQLILGEPIGDKPASDMEIVVLAILCYAIILLFWLLKLTTEINKSGISIRFFPFVKKQIAWERIEKAELINYGFIGGWGIVFSAKYGTVYSTSGKIGLALQLKSGKKILIGTQKKKDLERVLARFIEGA